MALPNRRKEVAAIAAKYPQSFGPPDASIDRRRRLLMPIIVRELNKLDGENWFLLNRLDRNDDDPRPGRLTSDVIVWGPTKEHVDVLSGNGAMWQEHPAITDPDWKLEHHSQWPSWDDVQPGPTPNPDPVPEPPPPTPSVGYGDFLSASTRIANALVTHRGGYAPTDLAHFLWGLGFEARTVNAILDEIQK